MQLIYVILFLTTDFPGKTILNPVSSLCYQKSRRMIRIISNLSKINVVFKSQSNSKRFQSKENAD